MQKEKIKKGFRVKIQKTESNSNYNQSVSVFRIGEKLPLFGTIVKEDYNKQEIINWANNQINQLGFDIIEVDEVDLFEHYETLPKPVQKLIFKEVETYDQCEKLLEKLKTFGYTFDYYLDAQPYNLRKI